MKQSRSSANLSGKGSWSRGKYDKEMVESGWDPLDKNDSADGYRYNRSVCTALGCQLGSGDQRIGPRWRAELIDVRGRTTGVEGW